MADEKLAYYLFVGAMACICFSFFYVIFKIQYNKEKKKFEQSNSQAGIAYPPFVKWLLFQGEYGTKEKSIQNYLAGKKRTYIMPLIILALIAIDFTTGGLIMKQIMNLVTTNLE